MINRYETTIIVNPVLSEDEIQKIIKKYRKYLTDNDAKIVFENNWGMQKLAYSILHKNTGYYYLYEFDAPTDFINKLEIQYKRDENILRFLTIHLDKHAIAYNEKKRLKAENNSKENNHSKKTAQQTAQIEQ